MFQGTLARTGTIRNRSESGFILLGVLILLFLFTLALAIAAPVVAKDIQRDKDEEAVQRGKQYKRAIRLYYKKYNTYPTTIAQLENTNDIRYLRKKYLDPITGKDDWRLIHVGEAKVPVLGFFGQPLTAGQSSVTTGLAGNGTGGTSNIFGNNTGTFSGSGSASSSGGTTGSGDGTTPAAPAGQLPGMGTAGLGGAGGSAGAGGTGTTGTNSSGVFGGGSIGPIVGVGLPVEKKSLVIYHKQDGYKKWEFTYDPIEEQMYSGSGSLGGGTNGNAAGIGTNPTSTSGGTTTNSQSPNQPNSPTPVPSGNGNGSTNSNPF